MIMCKVCNEEGETYGNRGLICKRCQSTEGNRKKKLKENYHNKLIGNQRSRVKNGEVSEITYSPNELKEWLNNQETYYTLHKNWVDSNYDRKLAPSIDRIDDYLGYTLDNIELMTWEENRIKGINYIISGKNQKLSVGFIQTEKNTDKFVAYYFSGQEASRATGINRSNITRCADGKCSSAGGFMWRFAR